MDGVTKIFDINKESFTANNGAEGPNPSLTWMTTDDVSVKILSHPDYKTVVRQQRLLTIALKQSPVNQLPTDDR